MTYKAEFRSFLNAALNVMNERIRRGYRFQFAMDEVVEFTDTGVETSHVPRARLYLLVREVSEAFMSSAVGTELLEKLVEDPLFTSHLNLRTADGQPVTEKESLRHWIGQRYLRFFVEQYVSMFEYEQPYPIKFDEEKFSQLFHELIAALNETTVTSVCVHPLWHFTSKANEIILSPEVRLRLLTTDERRSLYSLTRHVGSFPSMDLHNVKYGIEVALEAPVSDVNSPQCDTFVPATIDALRLIHKGGVQAPLRFHTLRPVNRWRNIATSTRWGHAPVSYSMGAYALSEADIDQLHQIWGILVRDTVKDNKLLSRVRSRIDHLYASMDATDRLVDCLIILESIYLNDTDKAEITYKLSSRAAVFLEDEFVKRKRTKDLIQKLYDLRSKLVHGSDILQRHLKFNGENLSIHQFAEMSEDIARKSVLKLIQTDELLRKYDIKYFDDILLQ